MKEDEVSFFTKVYEVARLIPLGKVTSYGAIASYLGTAKSARMVGWALNSCHTQKEFVPAHRVVNKQGLLTGKIHFGGNSMEELLSAEGIVVEENQIQDLEKVFWDPNKELL